MQRRFICLTAIVPCALGLATETVPPPDLSDREALKAFLVQVESRIQFQATPGG